MFHTTFRQKLKNPRVVAADRKLDVAIRASTIEHQLNKLRSSGGDYECKLLYKYFPQVMTSEITPDLCACVMSDILSGGTLYNAKEPIDIRRLYELVKDNFKVQHEYMTESFKTDNKNKLKDKFNQFVDKIKPSSEVYDLLVWIDKISSIVERLSLARKYPKKNVTLDESLDEDLKRQSVSCPSLSLKVMWTTDIILVTYKSRTWLLPRCSFLQLHNKLCDLLSVMILITCESGVSLEDDAYTITIEFIKEMCHLLQVYQNDFFSLSGSLEGLCTGEILIKTEKWKNDALIDVLSKELVNETGFDYKSSYLRQLIRKASIPLIAEMSCLSKIVGHPHVDMDAGLEKVHTRANEEIPINVAAVGYCTASIKETFILNFIKRHHRWPSTCLEHDAHPAIKEAWAKNVSPRRPEIRKKFGDLVVLDWHKVELGPELKFQYLDNMIPYLQDKVISVTKSRLLDTWLSNDRIEMSEKRLLLHYLVSDEVSLDHKAFIDKYVNSSEGMEEVMDYLVVRLCPKEKEPKIKPRLFGCMTYLNRCRMLVQEKNVMHFLDLYNDDQAMTLSEFRMVKKIYSFRNLKKAYTGYTVFMFNCDAQGWCLGFRDASVRAPLAQTLDRIYYKRVFSRTQEWYENTFFYADDVLGSYFWEGQKGGVEGLSQDTWVVIYTSQIKYAFDGTGYYIVVLCKGDDLRVSVAVPDSELEGRDRKAFVAELMRRISDVAKKFGHKMKVQESYASELFMSFSKQYAIENVELSSQFRKIQKCYGSNNAILPTLDEYVGTSYANAHSACYAGVTHYSCYVVALVWSYYYLLTSKDPYYRNMTNEELVVALLVPSGAGGFPIIFLHNMFVRAESDLLSAFVDIAFYCRKYEQGYWRIMENVLTQELMDPEENRKLLALDPYGLPLSKPISAKSFLRKEMRKVLQVITKNTTISDLLNMYDDDLRLEFLKCITSSKDEIQARIISAIYAASPFATIDELVSSFDSGKSIWQMIIFGSRIRSAMAAMRKAITMDREVGKWRIRMIRGECSRGTVLNLYERCPMKFVMDWRKLAFGVKVITVNNPPLGHFLSFISPYGRLATKHEQENHFVYESCPVTSTVSMKPAGDQYTCGDKEPFMGQKTSTGTDEPAIHFVEKNPVLSKIRQNLMISSFTSVGQSNIPDLIENILKCYTDTPFSDLSPYQAIRRKGTATHHIRGSSFRESIVPNNHLNLYTQIQSESKTHISFKTTPAHHNVNFLHIMCHSTSMYFLELEVSPQCTQPKTMWVVTNDCDHCNQPIQEEPIILQNTSFITRPLPLVKALKIGEEAEALLRQEIVRFRKEQEGKRAPRVLPTDYTVEEASKAVIQSLLASVLHQTQELIVRYNIYHMTPEVVSIFNNLSSGGSHKQISLTEVKKIEPRLILEGISAYVVEFCLKNFRRLSPLNLDAVLQRQQNGTLPWTFLLSLMERAGLLSGLVRECSLLYARQPSMAFTNADSSAKFIGSCIMHHFYESVEYNLDVYHTNYEDTERIRQRVLALEHVYRKSLFSVVFEESIDLAPLVHADKPGVSQDQVLSSLQDWQMVVAKCICIMLTPIDDSIHQRDFEAGEDEEIHLLDIDEMKIDLLGSILDEEWIYYGWYKSWVEHTSRCDIHYVATTLDETDIYNASEEIRNISCQVSINIRSMDIMQCVGLLRCQAIRDDYVETPVIDVPSVDVNYIKSPTGLSRSFKIVVHELLIDPSVKEYGEPVREEIFCDQTYFCRWGGDGVTSLSKLAEILVRLRLTDARQKGWVFTLGEGYGGVSRFILENTQSHVVFNSIEATTGQDVRPEIVLLDPLLADRIHYKHTARGYNDLRENETYQVLKTNYPVKPWLVVCDAECDFTDPLSVNIWMKVVRFYLEVRSQNGVLILKVFSCHTSIVSQVITYLKYYTREVHLYRCSSSHYGHEAYIIAQGISRPYVFHHGEHLPYAVPSINAKCINFDIAVSKSLRDARGGNYMIPEDSSAFVARAMQQFNIHAGTLLSCIETRLGINQVELANLLPGCTSYEALTILRLEDRAFESMVALTGLHEDNRLIGRRDTLAHEYRIIEGAMRLVGCIAQLKHRSYDRVVTPVVIQETWNEMFTLSPRYKIDVNVEDHMLVVTHVEECPFYGKESFIEGVHIALRIQGYLGYIRN